MLPNQYPVHVPPPFCNMMLRKWLSALGPRRQLFLPKGLARTPFPESTKQPIAPEQNSHLLLRLPKLATTPTNPKPHYAVSLPPQFFPPSPMSTAALSFCYLLPHACACVEKRRRRKAVITCGSRRTVVRPIQCRRVEKVNRLLLL